MGGYLTTLVPGNGIPSTGSPEHTDSDSATETGRKRQLDDALAGEANEDSYLHTPKK